LALAGPDANAKPVSWHQTDFELGNPMDRPVQRAADARAIGKARMPAFPARAEMLAVGLSHEHGFGVNDDPAPPRDPKLAEIGAKLIPQQGGVQLHQLPRHRVAESDRPI
jgi:hypothetical protein